MVSYKSGAGLADEVNEADKLDAGEEGDAWASSGPVQTMRLPSRITFWSTFRTGTRARHPDLHAEQGTRGQASLALR